MFKKIGFIGAGNMGSAIIEGLIKSGDYKPENIIVFDKNASALKLCKEKNGVKTVNNIADTLVCDILFLCVKPNVLYDVIKEIKKDIKPDLVIVSIAAGQSIEKIETAFEKEINLIRVMPNTPALCGEGMSALSPNKNMKNDDRTDDVLKMFETLGKADIIDEKLMDAVTGISGSSPAYVFMFIEALADAGVLAGMPRDKSYKFAAQAVLGSAKMVLETGKHPAELKDMVCSPAGTTIEAVRVLEEKGMRSAVIEAVNACVEKSKEM